MTHRHRHRDRVRHGLLAVLLVLAVTPTMVEAQSASKADDALARIDAKQCDAAVDLINEGMLAGEATSFFVAGQLFQHGYCLVQNVSRSIRLYERGALLGDRPSARALAIMHARGDGVPQSYPQAGRWYAVADTLKRDGSVATADAYAAPEVVVATYIAAVNDVAMAMTVYPREAVDQGVTGRVKVRFDPRFARVTIVTSSDSRGSTAAGSPDRHDFERALLAGYADAIRLLPRPAMSPNVDNSVEREVVFDRRVHRADQPEGLQWLARR